MCRDDRGQESGESFLDLLTPGRISHLDSLALASNQARISQRFEMLRQRRLRNIALLYRRERGTCMRVIRVGDAREDRDPHRVRECVKNSLDGHVLDSRMCEWLSHFFLNLDLELET